MRTVWDVLRTGIMSLPFLQAVSHMYLLPDPVAGLCCCLSKLLFSWSRWKKREREAVFLPANTFPSAGGLTEELVL